MIVIWVCIVYNIGHRTSTDIRCGEALTREKNRVFVEAARKRAKKVLKMTGKYGTIKENEDHLREGAFLWKNR